MISDPYRSEAATAPLRFLHRLNPLAKLFGPLPAIVLLIFTRDLALPLAAIALAWLLILVGARFSRIVLGLLIGLPLLALLISFSFALWVDPAKLSDPAPLFALGGWSLPAEAWHVGLATALRIIAVASLALIGALTTTGPDTVRAAVQQLRVPYRVGYTALAAYRFVPRFGHELGVIRAAHRVRGVAVGRGPIAAVRRWASYPVPLLAGGIRHAERVALAMDARGFGAHAERTERHLVPWRRRDTVFVLLCWAATAAVLLLVGPAAAGTPLGTP